MLDLSNGQEIRTPYFEIDYKTWEERELEKMLEEVTHIAEDEGVTNGVRQIIAERLMVTA